MMNLRVEVVVDGSEASLLQLIDSVMRRLDS